MKRSRLILFLSVAGLAACSASDTTAPGSSHDLLSTPAAVSFQQTGGVYDGGTLIPGSIGNAGTAPAPADQKRLTCNISAPITGSATIGAEGGFLFIGANILVVPPGALTQKTTLSGTVDAGNSFKITFEPHGLQFKKPAGLVLDASSCAGAPNIVYLDEQGGIAERITAIYSTWWRRVAAPLDHFSVYALDM